MWHKMLWPFCNTGHLCGGKGLLLPGPGTTLDLHLGKQYQHHLLQIPPGPAAPAVPAPVSSISKPTTADVGVQAVSSTSNPITADVGVQAGGSFLNFVDKDVDAGQEQEIGSPTEGETVVGSPVAPTELARSPTRSPLSHTLLKFQQQWDSWQRRHRMQCRGFRSRGSWTKQWWK